MRDERTLLPPAFVGLSRTRGDVVPRDRAWSWAGASAQLDAGAAGVLRRVLPACRGGDRLVRPLPARRHAARRRASPQLLHSLLLVSYAVEVWKQPEVIHAGSPASTTHPRAASVARRPSKRRTDRAAPDQIRGVPRPLSRLRAREDRRRHPADPDAPRRRPRRVDERTHHDMANLFNDVAGDRDVLVAIYTGTGESFNANWGSEHARSSFKAPAEWAERWAGTDGSAPQHAGDRRDHDRR